MSCRAQASRGCLHHRNAKALTRRPSQAPVDACNVDGPNSLLDVDRPNNLLVPAPPLQCHMLCKNCAHGRAKSLDSWKPYATVILKGGVHLLSQRSGATNSCWSSSTPPKCSGHDLPESLLVNAHSHISCCRCPVRIPQGSLVQAACTYYGANKTLHGARKPFSCCICFILPLHTADK